MICVRHGHGWGSAEGSVWSAFGLSSPLRQVVALLLLTVLRQHLLSHPSARRSRTLREDPAMEDQSSPRDVEWLESQSDLGRAVSRILSAPKLFGGENHLSQQPVPGTRSALRNLERAAPGSPIWPCTRWGFPCLRACAWSGGLLPHLFTLAPSPFPGPGRFHFLWHCPSGRLAASPPACIPPWASLRRPRPVTRHRALWCSDFPPPPNCSRESDSPPFQNHSEYSRPAAG